MQANVAKRFWSDESGAILSAELVIILTVVVLGLITGLACLQQAVVAELQDVAGAFSSLNQSYFTSSFRGCWKIWGRTSGTAGSMFIDRRAGVVAWGPSEIGVGPGAATYAAPVAPSVAPSVDCPPNPSQAAPHGVAVPCPTCPPEPCPPAREPVIPQGPAPQLSPQSW